MLVAAQLSEDERCNKLTLKLNLSLRSLKIYVSFLNNIQMPVFSQVGALKEVRKRSVHNH